MNLAEKVSRTASKTYLGAPLSLFYRDLSDNKELCITGQEISQLTLLMLGSYVYFAVIAIITITWEIFIIDYSAECDDNFVSCMMKTHAQCHFWAVKTDL